METPCIRCGKTRIVKRKWKETVERGAPEIRQKRELQESRKTSVKI
ncbi:MAG: hypothetical protein UU05_C0043G0003 [Candidatus Curtissbacteria bacterium GW2011_GWA1_40_47]|nr:MAG: hypothetical protein UU05_C0043G0003 [Candidatus Curtissbacteria bacterium GW2011_GWA1_40_47]